MRKTIKTLTKDYKIGPEITGEIVEIGGYKFCVRWANRDRVEATEVSSGTFVAGVNRKQSKNPKLDLLDFLKQQVEAGEMQAALFRVRAKIDGYRMRLEQLIRETPDLPINEL